MSVGSCWFQQVQVTEGHNKQGYEKQSKYLYLYICVCVYISVYLLEYTHVPAQGK